MPYSYPYSRDVVYALRNSYPRGCKNLEYLLGCETVDVNEILIKAFRTNQIRWRSWRYCIKWMDAYEWTDLRKISSELYSKFLILTLYDAENYAIDTEDARLTEEARKAKLLERGNQGIVKPPG